MAITTLGAPVATTQIQAEAVEYQLRFLDPVNRHLTQPPTAETRSSAAAADADTMSARNLTGDRDSIPQPQQRLPPPHDPSPLAWRAINSESSFYPSQHFIISCGTVTVDPAAAKVLLVYNRPNGIYQLPKGRKDIGEDGLLATALRETLEETGYAAKPLRLKIPTRSSQPSGTVNGGVESQHGTLKVDGAEVPAKGLTTGVRNSEPAGCVHWDDTDAQARKIVFFFAAECDSSAAPRPRPAEDEVKHEVWWFGYGEAMGRLCFDAERKAVLKVLGELRRCGYQLQLDLSDDDE